MVGQRRRALVITSPLGSGLGCADQADTPGEFGQGNLVLRIKEAFALELAPELVDLLLEVAGAHTLDPVGHEAQTGLFDPQVGSPVYHHPVALAEFPGLGGEGPESHDVDGDVLEVVAQGQIC